jgi:hypothetical protein
MFLLCSQSAWGRSQGIFGDVVDLDGCSVLNQKVKTGRWRCHPETELAASAGIIVPWAIRIVATFPSHRIIKLMMLRADMTSVRQMFPSHRPSTGH